MAERGREPEARRDCRSGRCVRSRDSAGLWCGEQGLGELSRRSLPLESVGGDGEGWRRRGGTTTSPSGLTFVFNWEP